MKKRFNIFYLVAMLYVILAVIRFVQKDVLMGVAWIGCGILMFLVGGLDIAKRKKGSCENEAEK